MSDTDPYRHERILQSYYKLHSPVYDATRWAFLFGRNRLINRLPDLPFQPRILEIGCGTGKNIEQLCYCYPDAHITGIDLSNAMLKQASRRITDSDHITLINAKYGTAEPDRKPYDLILLSYSLTMMGNEIEHVLQQTTEDLKKNGYIGIVDFHETPFGWFKKWMARNHVRMSGAILPLLNKYYRPQYTSVHNAYGGLWRYLQFIGQR